jgi:outer membrane protein assembly factor BamD (BamD/ComL family)
MRKTRLFTALLIACAIWPAQAQSHESPMAQIEKGLKLINEENYTGAYNLLGGLDTGSNLLLKARVNYLAGYALFKSGRFKEALEVLSTVTDNILIGDYALAHIAQIHSDEERYKKVIETVERMKTLFPYSPLRDEMTMLEAEALVETGNKQKAVKLLQKHVGTKPENAHKALWMLAHLLEEAGRLDETYKIYQRIFYRHPHTELAEPARGETVRLYNAYRGRFRTADPPEKLKRVKVLIKEREYRLAELYIRSIDMSKLSREMRAKLYIQLAKALDKINRDKEAIKVYQRVAARFAKTDSAPTALYRMARLQWNRGNSQSAKKLMDRVAAEYPRHERAPTALYVSGKIDESAGSHQDAIRKWMKVVHDYPKSDIAPTCLWSVGWNYYRQEDYINAQNAFNIFTKNYPDSDQIKKVLYWQGRSLINIGNRGKKVEQFERLVQEFPNSYYTLLVTNGMDNSIYTHMIRFHPDEEMLDEIIDQNIMAAVKKYEKRPELNGKQTWALDSSRNWLALGFRERAKQLLDILAKEIKTTNGHLIWLGYQYYRAGFYGDMLWRLDMVMADKRLGEELRRFLTMVMYPVPHWQTILFESETYNVDPILVLAVIRQESRFDTEVVSRADARGLMQIIPPTARRISKKLAIEDYTDDLLHVPEVNIKMGVYYLSSLLRRSGGELAPALASYNAGFRVVKKWLERLPYDDVSEFIETIPYPETRGYVKNVLRNYGIYQEIYYKTLRTEFALKR